LHLPEYVNLISLLQKGIATHHSKMLPVLREIVEILFARGSIKLLFATESVAIGLNLPVKSCLFTDVYKHDGHALRILQAHEYTQAAGRAGRLGLDTVGHVFHLNNLFRPVDSISYKMMMNGKPQTLKSKFRISYNLLLNLMEIGDNDFQSFSNQSMLTVDVKSQVGEFAEQITKFATDVANLERWMSHLKIPIEKMTEYLSLQEACKTAVNKKRKEIDRRIEQIVADYPLIARDSITAQCFQKKSAELALLRQDAAEAESYMANSVGKVVDILAANGFIQEQEQGRQLTRKGKIAAQLKETHSLIFADLVESMTLDKLSSTQIIAFLSCFTNISVQEDLKDLQPHTDDVAVKDAVLWVADQYVRFQDIEAAQNIVTGFDYGVLHYDMILYAKEWCLCENVDACKLLLQKMGEEKQIFLGDFSKALLKINNIACELEKVCELTGNMELLGKLREIPGKTLKYVVTNQSLYI
jgi:superfamily II RNA helicase